MLPGAGPVYTTYDIHERHVILKAALHFRLYSCLVAARYIIAVLPSIYNSYNFLMLRSVQTGHRLRIQCALVASTLNERSLNRSGLNAH